jgi:hypothetical protein
MTLPTGPLQVRVWSIVVDPDDDYAVLALVPVGACCASLIQRPRQTWGTVTIGLGAAENCRVVEQFAALVGTGEALTVLRTEEGILLRGGGVDVSAPLYIGPHVVGD